MNDQTFYESLRYFVYLLIDPRDVRVFYVGKGCRARPLDHLMEEGDHPKIDMISRIRASGFAQPVIKILRHHLDEREALLVESATIDLLQDRGIELTNQVSGHDAGSYGIATWEELRSRYASPPADISEPAAVIRINQLWRRDMSAEQLYAATRGWWKINPLGRRPVPQLALAVADGVVRGVYVIEAWEPASPIPGRDDWDGSQMGRVQFTGRIATDDAHTRYLGKTLPFKQGSANPVLYINC